MVDAIGEVASEDAEPGADLEHHIVGTEAREAADHAEDVLVDEKVLAEPFLREHAHGRANTLAAFAPIRSASSAGSSPRVAASAASVCTT